MPPMLGLAPRSSAEKCFSRPFSMPSLAACRLERQFLIERCFYWAPRCRQMGAGSPNRMPTDEVSAGRHDDFDAYRSKKALIRAFREMMTTSYYLLLRGPASHFARRRADALRRLPPPAMTPRHDIRWRCRAAMYARGRAPAEKCKAQDVYFSGARCFRPRRRRFITAHRLPAEAANATLPSDIEIIFGIQQPPRTCYETPMLTGARAGRAYFASNIDEMMLAISRAVPGENARHMPMLIYI